MVAECGRPGVYATNDTNQTTGMCLPKAEPRPASFTDEAVTGLTIMVSSSLPKNRTARPAHTQQVRSFTRLTLVQQARHIYHGRNCLSHYNVGQTYLPRSFNDEKRYIHCAGMNSGTPRPLVNPKGKRVKSPYRGYAISPILDNLHRSYLLVHPAQN